jgi:hypothetical protein
MCRSVISHQRDFGIEFEREHAGRRFQPRTGVCATPQLDVYHNKRRCSNLHKTCSTRPWVLLNPGLVRGMRLEQADRSDCLQMCSQPKIHRTCEYSTGNSLRFSSQLRFLLRLHTSLSRPTGNQPSASRNLRDYSEPGHLHLRSYAPPIGRIGFQVTSTHNKFRCVVLILQRF